MNVLTPEQHAAAAENALRVWREAGEAAMAAAPDDPRPEQPQYTDALMAKLVAGVTADAVGRRGTHARGFPGATDAKGDQDTWVSSPPLPPGAIVNADDGHVYVALGWAEKLRAFDRRIAPGCRPLRRELHMTRAAIIKVQQW